MKIAITGGKPASESDILALESALGCRLSAAFRTFVEANDGAEPENNVFKVGSHNESGVRQFIPVAAILDELTFLDDLSTHAYPIAWDESGNYVVIDEDQQGAVFFWDHELPEPLTKLASDFGEFLNLLQPFDPASVQLKLGQVESAWIDPEFLKLLEEK